MSAANDTILCFGEALIDFLASEPAEGQARTFRQFAGGAPANAAVAVAKLGGRCEFVGMLGHDMFGDFLLHSLREAGAGVRYVRRTAAAKTALAFVSLDAHGERSFSFYRPPAADLLFRDADFDDSCFAAAGIFHVCSNSLTDTDIAAVTLSGMARARAAGALVSLDLNLRPALWPDAAPALPVLVTDGAAPMRWFVRGRSGELSTFEVKAVDTTAAGDAFIGGLLSQFQREGIDTDTFDAFLSQSAELERCLRYASACGALAVTRHGAFAALPTHAEAIALLDASAAVEA
jgi:fructokinase